MSIFEEIASLQQKRSALEAECRAISAEIHRLASDGRRQLDALVNTTATQRQKPHWTQTPEGRARIGERAKKAWAADPERAARWAANIKASLMARKANRVHVQ